MNKWKILECKDILQEGGTAVKRTDLEENPDKYDVLLVNMLPDSKCRSAYAVLCTVDVSDYYDEMEEISGGEKLSEYFAADIVEYYGIADFNPRAYRTSKPEEYEDFVVSEDELKDWLAELEVTEEHEEKVRLSDGIKQMAS